MEIKKHGFYLIKNEFFNNMNDPCLPYQKRGRPVYYCIPDKNVKGIFWVIPMTTKLDKVCRIIKESGGEEKCKKFALNPSDKNSAFNIGDIFPVGETDIEREFTKNGKHYILKNKKTIEDIEKKAFSIISMKMVRSKFNKNEINVREIYNSLLQELAIKKANYNCLTGNPIEIGNHASGETKWVSKTDVMKHKVEIKPDAKAVQINVVHIEEEKLYMKPISYYNISELCITKDLEQRFKLRKEKVQQKIKEKDRGMER